METDKNKTLRIIREEVQRVVGKDLDDLKDTLKRIESQNKITITHLHNLRQENDALRELLKKLLAAFVECLSDPASQSEIDAILRDFLVTKRKLEKHDPRTPL